MQPSNRPELETATLAGGCFWCLEAVYDQLKGVEDVVSGYSGGHKINPTYREVCNETTGHAEAVQLKFDPNVVTFRDILDVFFTIHDPTTLNRQGNDQGESYRSAIFYHTPEQQRIVQEKIADLDASGIWGKKAVTQVTSFDKFYAAEDYHQNYFEQNPNAGYCRMIVAPKVAKFRKLYVERLKR